ncbi:Maf family protein [Actinokineospora xionganensis]|uniref:Nucleoside triphosphate pyrophosphatase n=1 Tax=Actinokineospora xionganensis TaxID=2684470 RepID=A0ABR7L805_9PSEU|nr:nucleoside triphosphate pyrophosphatase [Actinokineospora xionganensis]MBC6448447.1 septum formation inhibitor Maf [Actinokineospora xionganensis]
MRFVLASQSPARLGLLRDAGIDPVVRVSGVDEEAIEASLPDAKPDTVVVALAEAKARAVLADVVAEHPDALIVGCDSMLHFDGQLMGKPATVDIARERWGRMAGNTGDLMTGHAVLRVEGGEVTATAVGTESTVVRFGKPTERELESYLASGEPLRVAGAFTLDGHGGWFVDGIDGDSSGVIGISLPLMRRLLNEVGLSVVDFWSAPTVPPPRNF